MVVPKVYDLFILLSFPKNPHNRLLSAVFQLHHFLVVFKQYLVIVSQDGNDCLAQLLFCEVKPEEIEKPRNSFVSVMAHAHHIKDSIDVLAFGKYICQLHHNLKHVLFLAVEAGSI